MTFQHWQLSYEDAEKKNAIAWLRLDVAEKSVNVLTEAVLDELAAVVKLLEAEPPARGLAMVSAKPGGFVYGADINGFDAFPDAAAVASHVTAVHETFDRLASLPFPTVVGIDGVAVGGGLEIALPFDKIIITASPKTALGFPEVNLGLMPGYGGTGRAWARIGSQAVLDAMLTGRMIRAAEAVECGLADSIVEDAEALPAALKSAIEAMDSVKPERPQRQETAAETRDAVAAMREAHTARLREEHTPAAFRILDHIADHAPDAGAISRAEQQTFPMLMMSEASFGLRRQFQLTDSIRRSARGDSGIRHLHVIGAGVMGGDIAAVAAMKGLKVTLSDMNDAAVDAALQRAASLYERRLKSADAVAAALGRLIADADGQGLGQADLVIEAVAENPAIKQQVFRDAERKISPDCILATNTSAIPLEVISEALEQPERLIGLHFFNPVPVLPLVEVVWSDKSDQRHVSRGMQFAGAIGKMPIRCKSAPGFLVNRALLPYIFHAIVRMTEGENADLMDQALVAFGMPMGPIELADQIGLDVMHAVGEVLGMPAAAATALAAKLKAGDLGRKSGAGFYSWKGKQAQRPRADYPPEQLQTLAAMLLEPMIAECRAAVDEGVVDTMEMADAGMILGIGFPGFRGGPLFWDNRR